MASSASPKQATAGKGTNYIQHAIRDLLEDEDFLIDTARIRAAVETARKVQAWVAENGKEASFFEDQVLKHLSKCTSAGISSISKREVVWGQYHRLRASREYQNFWKVFLTVAGCRITDDPIFCQRISHHIFSNLLKDTFPVLDATSSEGAYTSTLSFEESNAIRYVAGYVCNKLYKKMKKKLTADDLSHGIEDMVKDEWDEDDESTKWIDMIDRGGLFKVNDRAYSFFVSIEVVVRRFFQLKKAMNLQAGMKDMVVASVLEDEDVQLQWSMIGVELEEKNKNTLMHMCVNEWVNIRGFSFAGAYIELYKQATKTALQKSRALRSKLSGAKKKKKEEEKKKEEKKKEEKKKEEKKTSYE